MATSTRLDYCQYLLSSQINYTLTSFADYSQHFSHDMINRHLAADRVTPSLVWENVSPHVISNQQGYIVFDDTVLDERYSFNIELVRRQYSGNAHQVMKGIGVVSCTYVNPNFRPILDYRLSDLPPRGDGQTKLDQADAIFNSLSLATAL